MRFFRAFSSVVRQMPGFNSQSRGTVRTLKLVVTVLCYRLYSCVVVIVLLLFVSVLLLFVLIYVLKLCVLHHCHRVLTQLQSSNIYIYIYTRVGTLIVATIYRYILCTSNKAFWRRGLFRTCILMVGLYIGYPGIFHILPPTLQPNTWTVPKLKLYRFLTNPLQFIFY